MKPYKAIFIDGRKFLRIFFVGLTFIGLLILIFLSKPDNFLFSVDDNFSYENIISGTLSGAGAANQAKTKIADNLKNMLSGAASIFLGFDPTIPESIISSEIPLLDIISNSELVVLAQENTEKFLPPEPTEPTAPSDKNNAQPILPENQAPIKEVNLAAVKDGSKKISLGNETSYSINIDDMLNSPLSLNMNGNGPKVLIIHTHGTESYTPDGTAIYDMTASDRSTDTEKNVVKAGEVICDILNKKGIETLHDKTMHDNPSYNGSYASSLKSMEKYLKEYPSIQVIFDIHRDSIVYNDNTKVKAVTDINGKTAAQLMFVVGTDEKGLTHPNWRENIKTAIHFQNAINQRYPTLMRHINLRQERFNGHTTHGSMIIETGSSGNTLTEALYGISLAAECIGDYLVSLK